MLFNSTRLVTPSHGRSAAGRAGWAVLGILALVGFSTGRLEAGTIIYTDRPTFEAATTNRLTDDFNSPAYGFINSAATMKALSVASIDYRSTFFSVPDWNLVVSGGRLCWGCNGSGEIGLTDTPVGTANGVSAFGIDIINNSGIPLYDAFVTFGDGSTLNIDLGSGPGFFGITSDLLIKNVRFGPTGGGTTGNGYFELDNVTVGQLQAVPEPASLVVFGLMGAAVVGYVRRKKKTVAG